MTYDAHKKPYKPFLDVGDSGDALSRLASLR